MWHGRSTYARRLKTKRTNNQRRFRRRIQAGRGSGLNEGQSVLAAGRLQATRDEPLQSAQRRKLAAGLRPALARGQTGRERNAVHQPRGRSRVNDDARNPTPGRRSTAPARSAGRSPRSLPHKQRAGWKFWSAQRRLSNSSRQRRQALSHRTPIISVVDLCAGDDGMLHGKWKCGR